MPLNILIVGAGVCGPTIALLLQGANPNHNITVIERFPSLRTAGQQIDVKGQGVPLMKKLGLLDIIKSHGVAERGIEMVDSNGKQLSQFIVDESDKQSLLAVTTEYEIMRGDLVKVLYDAGLQRREELRQQGVTGGGLTYEFGKEITELSQKNNGVDVTFSDGQQRQFDIIIGADGQGSRTRRFAFGPEASAEAFKSLNIYTAFYSIPRVEGEGEIAKAYISHGCRAIATRNGNRPMTQVYLFMMEKDSERLRKSLKEPIETQKQFWAELYKGAGWETERLMRGLSTCDDLYTCELGQLKPPTLHNGRIVLAGDAGYCPSAFTGQGTATSFIGAYVLAGELARHGDDVEGAFKAYEDVIRSPIEELQKLPFGGSTTMIFPSSKLGAWLLHTIVWIMATIRIERILRWLLPEQRNKNKEEWKLPEYPELNLSS